MKVKGICSIVVVAAILAIAPSVGISQGIGLTYVNGSGFTDGFIAGRGITPADGGDPQREFNYFERAGGAGGFMQGNSPCIRSGKNYAHLTTLSTGMWAPGQTWSSGMTWGDTACAGRLEGTNDGIFMVATPSTHAETSVTFRVTAPPAEPDHSLVFEGTYNISLDTDELGISLVIAPGVTAMVVPGFGTMVTTTNVFNDPPVQTVITPGAVGAAGTFAIGVSTGDDLVLETASDTSIRPGSNHNASISTASSSVGGVVNEYHLDLLPGIGDQGGPGTGGPGSGGPGSGGPNF